MGIILDHRNPGLVWESPTVCVDFVYNPNHPPKVRQYPVKFSTLGIPKNIGVIHLPWPQKCWSRWESREKMLGLSTLASSTSHETHSSSTEQRSAQVGEGWTDLGLEREAALSGGTWRTVEWDQVLPAHHVAWKRVSQNARWNPQEIPIFHIS